MGFTRYRLIVFFSLVSVVGRVVQYGYHSRIQRSRPRFDFWLWQVTRLYQVQLRLEMHTLHSLARSINPLRVTEKEMRTSIDPDKGETWPYILFIVSVP